MTVGLPHRGHFAVHRFALFFFFELFHSYRQSTASLASNIEQQDKQSAYLPASISWRFPVEWLAASARTSATVFLFTD
jgi:hypothetical protein